MNFLDYINSIKNEENKLFLENVVESGFRSLFEEMADATIPTPRNPLETKILLDKTKQDQEDLNKLLAVQTELIQNQKELEQKAPDLGTTPN